MCKTKRKERNVMIEKIASYFSFRDVTLDFFLIWQVYLTLVLLEIWSKIINNFLEKMLRIFPVWLQNRLISVGLEPVLSHNEKS